jgi:hypothetical protein
MAKKHQRAMLACVPGLIFPVLAVLACAASGGEQGNRDAVEPPIAGQPVNFSGAIGSYRIAMVAEPTSLQAEDPIKLTIRINVSGSGSLKQINRPNLKIAAFTRHFLIQDGQTRDLPDQQAREFEYFLRPKNPGVKQIPAVPFVYFNPAIVPASKGYQWAYARAIPLTVRPRSPVAAAQGKGSSAVSRPPDSVLQVSTGADVLRRDTSFVLPGWLAMLGLALLPPVLCGLWLLGWRRLHPDASRVAKQRRSRAARLALKAIGSTAAFPHEEQARRVREIITEYLRERFDLGIYEPTPVEVSVHLQQKGLSAQASRQASLFFGACDAARFAPQAPGATDSWTAAATELVQALEEESWALQP